LVLALYREQEELCCLQGNKKQLLLALISQATIPADRQDCYFEALPLAEEAFEIAQEEAQEHIANLLRILMVIRGRLQGVPAEREEKQL
jgi:hypothetical protein